MLNTLKCQDMQTTYGQLTVMKEWWTSPFLIVLALVSHCFGSCFSYFIVPSRLLTIFVYYVRVLYLAIAQPRVWKSHPGIHIHCEHILLDKFNSISILQVLPYLFETSVICESLDDHSQQPDKHNEDLEDISPQNSFHTTLFKLQHACSITQN